MSQNKKIFTNFADAAEYLSIEEFKVVEKEIYNDYVKLKHLKHPKKQLKKYRQGLNITPKAHRKPDRTTAALSGKKRFKFSQRKKLKVRKHKNLGE